MSRRGKKKNKKKLSHARHVASRNEQIEMLKYHFVAGEVKNLLSARCSECFNGINFPSARLFRMASAASAASAENRYAGVGRGAGRSDAFRVNGFSRA